MVATRGVASRIRSTAGRNLRRAGLLPLPAQTFTPGQLEQLQAVVEQAVAGAAPTGPAPAEPGRILDAYASGPPSPQQAIDIFDGEWSCRFPEAVGVEAGEAGLFDDVRLHLIFEWLGDRAPGRVLELGPLEGAHTWMLEQAGATVHAIESNGRAFLKCLITKELLGMRNARFSRGDFVDFLRSDDQRYDLVLASGVLYHMVDPLELLRLIAARSDRLAIWTQYYDPDAIAAIGATPLFSGEPELVTLEGVEYRLHPKEYRTALEWGGFCGGPETYARWMERDQLIGALRQLGYRDVQEHLDHVDHPNGPAIFLLASR